MPVVVFVVTLAFAAMALVRGIPRVRAARTPLVGGPPLMFRDLVDSVVVTALRVGVVLLTLALAVVALLGSVAAVYGGVSLPRGVYVAAGAVVILSVITLTTFGRRT